MSGEVLKISKRYSQPNLSYARKTNRGGPLGPPSSGRGLIHRHYKLDDFWTPKDVGHFLDIIVGFDWTFDRT